MKRRFGVFLWKGNLWSYVADDDGIVAKQEGTITSVCCDRRTGDALADAKCALCLRDGGHEFSMVYNDGHSCLNCGCDNPL